MTEVTRIACPGCHASLRFEPEALDFPANCGSCDGRFTVGVYVRVACPSCRHGSKIRERYLGQEVRCVRCRHDFLADESIVQGGGRMLVARLLDDDDRPTGTPTLQPFLGHARAASASAPAAAAAWDPFDDERTAEIPNDMQAKALDQERLAEEVARLEGRLVRQSAEYAEAVRSVGLENSSLSITIERLNRAVHSSLAGEAEALGRMDRLAEGFQQSENRMLARLELELRNGRDLDRLVQASHAELEALRSLEVQRAFERPRLVRERDEARAEAEAARSSENSRSIESARLLAEVESLHAEVEAARSLDAARSLEIERLRGEVEATRSQLESMTAERDRFGQELVAARFEAMMHLEAKARLAEEVEGLRGEAQRASGRSTEADESLRQEVVRLLGELDHTRSESERREKALAAEIRRVKVAFEKVDRARAELETKLAQGEPTGREIVEGAAGEWPKYDAIVASATVPPLEPSLASSARDRVHHRDLAMTLLYADDFDEMDHPLGS